MNDFYITRESYAGHYILALASQYYDIRKQYEGSLCYDFSNVDKFFINEKVKDVLEVDIPSLLEDGIKLLVYAGEEDLICNWLGNYRWVRAMKWSGQKKFKLAPKVKFIVDGAEVGSLTSHGPLSFLKVYQAGHMVPMDQPKA
ncbi:hypothetical protein TanjilG_00377 [Lupinus angustifolius]|uniref:Uncharacterized protein n=1 Tax=Lupinus angustifolius TaxID=3871 RepID=A0A1J7FPY4_LUPAN|nr:hypothetical protein TanjilG_00377 [Lupinus angustifolius]